jgi:predicted N-acyltransferase
MFATSRFNGLNIDRNRSADSTQDLEYLRFDHHDDGRLVGSLPGVRSGRTFASGWSAPFGGPDFTRPADTATNVMATMASAFDALEAQGVETIRIKAKPTFYSGNEVAVQHTLFHHGFSVEQSELSYHIDLRSFSHPDQYEAALKSPARRALKHAKREPFEYGEAVGDAEWEVAYDIIARNRSAKGRPLLLSLEYILRLRDLFPGRVRFFVLRHAGVPVASALLYRLRPGIELVEYWGDDHGLERSPMNLLAAHVCQRAIAERIDFVDLGLSSVRGEPNQGLIQFKQSILARAELRLNFVRTGTSR